MKITAWMLALALSAGVTGCAGDIWSHDTRSTITPVWRWQVTGDFADPAKAIDGNIQTAAVCNKPQSNAQMTIDLGKPCLFNMVTLDHGAQEDGFARRMTLDVSMDGRDFTPVYSGAGCRRTSVMCWVTPVLARYIRIHAVMPAERPWTIAEVYVQ